MDEPMADFRWESHADAHVKFQIPTNWTTKATEEKAMAARSPDQGVGILFRYISLGAPEAVADEKLVLGELKSLVQDIKVTNPLTKFQQHGLTGTGLGGTGHRAGIPIGWFSIVFGDHRGHGVLAFGFGAASEFVKQYPTILKIMGSIQPITN
jgi:hypothetical protein